jgi:hypothetical protein
MHLPLLLICCQDEPSYCAVASIIVTGRVVVCD